ncbi:MAG: CopG family transcriptional regulator [Candidatus Electrothrix sp. ATG2]|nr:CopG family transcriptional regulator [Candidatus Electrothrix sp. ATG2]
MITLRLDPKLDQLLKNTAENLGLSKSELIRRSILDYIGRLKTPNAWDTGKDLFGKHASGRDDLAARRKELVRDKIRAKKK